MCGLLSLPHRAGAARWPSCSCATSGAWPPKREPHWEEDRERDKSKLSEWRATLCARAPVSYLWKCNYCCCLGSWRCYFVLTVKKSAVPSVVFFVLLLRFLNEATKEIISKSLFWIKWFIGLKVLFERKVDFWVSFSTCVIPTASVWSETQTSSFLINRSFKREVFFIRDATRGNFIWKHQLKLSQNVKKWKFWCYVFQVLCK